MTSNTMRAFLQVLIILFLPVAGFSQTSWAPVSYNVSVRLNNSDVELTSKFICEKTDFRFSPEKLDSSHMKSTIKVTTAILNRLDPNGTPSPDSIKYAIVNIESLRLYSRGAHYAGMFNVTLNGKTKQVEIPFDFKRTGDAAEFNSSFTISSRNFPSGIAAMTMNEPARISLYIKAKE